MNTILMCLVLAGAASANRLPDQFPYPDYMHNFPYTYTEHYTEHYTEFTEDPIPYLGKGLRHREPVTFNSASCKLVPSSGQHVSGEIYLRQTDSAVEVTGSVSGLSPGYHGFHVHNNGNVSDDCKAAGSHFNPSNKNHGSPQDSVRHVGDLGNIFADDSGHAQIQIVDSEIALDRSSARGIVGRAIVVHAKQDDLGKGNDAESLKTGNAGSRVACCVISGLSFTRRLYP